MTAMHRRADGFGLYIHWPFCLSKCPYCDFNSHVREGVPQDRWRDALLRELGTAAAQTGRRPLDSIFFGGGTPSLMDPETAGALIERARGLFDAADDIEITLEANPTSVETGRLEAFRAAGVNRVSLGVQALDDAALGFLGRGHSAREAVAAVEAAARLFPRFSFDLIYARPGQRRAAWREELAAALDLAGGHLSLYQLTIEPGTAFHTAHRAGKFALPAEEDAAALYAATQEIMEAAGLPAYEVSNHARPGEESRHNLVYWRHGDYLGIGPGAHGRVTKGGATHAQRRERLPERWLAAVERDGHALVEDAVVSPAECGEEVLLMGLRLSEGVPLARYEAAAQAPFPAARAQDLVEAGYLALTDGTVRATPEGRLRLDSVIAWLLGEPAAAQPAPAVS